ncbi:cytochrome P450 [Mycena filopes]|nr:cytochrome P450 [Mycena filopes]
MSPIVSSASLSLLAGLAATLLALRWKRQRQELLPLPPGPKKLPILGNLLDVPPNLQWEAYQRWSKEFDSDIIHLNVAGTSIVVLSSMEVIKDLFERRGAQYSDRPHAPMLNDLMGWSEFFGFMNHEERWRRHRKLFHEAFHIATVKQFDPQVRNSTHRLLRRILKDPHDMMGQFRHLAGALIMNITYGIEVKAKDDPYIQIAEESMHGLGIACIPGNFLVDLVPALKYVPSWFPGADFKRKARRWYDVTRQLVEVPFAETKRAMAAGTAPLSFVSLNLGQIAESGEKKGVVSEEEIRGTAAASYAAGADTTVSAMGTFVLAMLKHPEVQKKAQAELDAVIGHGHLPELSDAAALPYVSAVVKEVLRWENVAPIGIPHRILVDDEYRGYRIPANSIVIGNVWALMHDEEVYPDPKSFKPERFLLDGKLNPDVQDPEAVFGFGRRICPGRHLAQNSLWLTMASILAAFDISKAVDDDGKVIEPSYEYYSALVYAPLPFECSITPAVSADGSSNRGHGWG